MSWKKPKILLQKIDAFLSRIEERPYRAERIILVILFVGLVRSVEEIYLAYKGYSLLTLAHFTAFYFATYLGFTLLAAILVRRDWKQTSQVIFYGILVGILPPLIDVFVSGPGNFEYKYLTKFYPLLHGEGNPIGEALTVWLSLAAFAFYIYIRTRSVLRSLIGMVAAYAFLIFMVLYYPLAAKFIQSTGLEIRGNTARGLAFIFLSFVLYVSMNTRRFLPSLKRVNHALPWVVLVFLGATVIGGIQAMTWLHALIVLFIHQGIIFANDYYDRDSDRANNRICILNKDDVFIIHSLIVWIVLIMCFQDRKIGMLYILYVVATIAYHHPSFRLKDIFPLNHMTEGLVAALAFLVGMASASAAQFNAVELLYVLVVSIGFTVGSLFKDYKDIPGDRLTSTRTIYIILQDRGIALEGIHRGVTFMMLCLLLAPMPWLYTQGVGIFPILLVVLLLILPVFFTLRHANKVTAVERTVWLLSGYLISLVLVLEFI